MTYDFLFKDNSLDDRDRNVEADLYKIDIFGNPYMISMGEKHLHPMDKKEELYYIRKVRKLAKENDIDLIVSRPWQAYEKPLSPTALATLRKTIPEFVYPPTDVIRETWPAFQDPKHMSFRAADIYTEWLAREIDARAEEAPQS